MPFSVDAQTSPVIYIDFEEDDPTWTNHGAPFVTEARPFSGVGIIYIFLSFPEQVSSLKQQS